MEITLAVSGMSCGHCEKAVTDAVHHLDGVNKVEVSLNDGKVKVDFNPQAISIETICHSIEDQGYDVTTS